MSDVMRKKYRELMADETSDLATMKQLADNLYSMLECLGREISLAKTRLEESVMWATKHITG